MVPMPRKADPLRGERRRVGYYDKSGNRVFLLTQKDDDFFLYRQTGDGDGSVLTRLGKAKSPTVLEEKFKVYDETRGST